MNATATQKMILTNKILQIPSFKIEEVNKYIDSVISFPKQFNKENKLKGIWKNKGFEKIDDLNSEISDIRKELNNQIENKMI